MPWAKRQMVGPNGNELPYNKVIVPGLPRNIIRVADIIKDG